MLNTGILARFLALVAGEYIPLSKGNDLELQAATIDL